MAEARHLLRQESYRLFRRCAARARFNRHSRAVCRRQGETDLDADRYHARFHRGQLPATAGHAGHRLHQRRPAGSEDLFFKGSARFSRLPGGQPARVPRTGNLGAAHLVRLRETPAGTDSTAKFRSYDRLAERGKRPLAKTRGCPNFLGPDSPLREFEPPRREASIAAALPDEAKTIARNASHVAARNSQIL